MLQKALDAYKNLPKGKRILLEAVAAFFVFTFLVCAVFFTVFLQGQGGVHWDATNVHLLNLKFSSEYLSQGEIAQWTPHIFWGYPQITDPQTAIFYPFNFIISIFTQYTEPLFLVYLMLHFILAGFFMWMLAHYLSRSFLIGIFAGIAYMFSGFMVGHASHIGMLSTATWIPLLFLLLFISLRRQSYKWSVLTGLICGIVVLAGHAHTALIAVSAVVAYVLFDLLHTAIKKKKVKWHKLGILCVVGVTAFFISAVQLLPTYELQEQTVRDEVALATAQSESLHPYTLWNLISQNHQNVLRGEYTGPRDITQNYIYIGLLMPFLALAGAIVTRKKKMGLFFIFFAFISLGYALGRYFFIHELFYNFVPLFDKMRAPSAAVVMFQFSLILLAVLALNFLRKRVGKKLFIGIMLILTSFAALDLTYATGTAQTLYGRHKPLYFMEDIKEFRVENSIKENDENWDYGRAIWLHPDIPRRNMPQVSGLYAADGYNPLTPDRHMNFYEFMVNPPKDRVEEGEYDFDIRRYLFEFKIENENIFNMANIRHISCSMLIDGMGSVEEVREAGICANEDAFPYAYFVPNYELFEDVDNYDAALAQMRDTDFTTTVLLEEEPLREDGAMEDFEFNEDTAQIVRREAGSLKFNLDNDVDGFLVVTESFYPGWQATVNGQDVEILKGNYIFQAIPVEAGGGEVEFKYSSTSFRVGSVATLIGIVFVLGVGISMVYEKRRKN